MEELFDNYSYKKRKRTDLTLERDDLNKNSDIFTKNNIVIKPSHKRVKILEKIHN